MNQTQEVSRKSCRVLIKEIYKKDRAKVEKLLQGGANVRGTDYNGDTPLHHAVASRDIEIVRLLISHGADVNAENDCGFRPYNVALNDGFVEALEILLKDDAVVTEVDDKVRQLPSHVIDLFYDKVDLLARNVKGYTALHVATSVDDARAVRRLLNRGADLTVRGSYKHEMPLHLVVSREVAELLLDHGALIDAHDRYAVTPLSEVAVKNKKRLKRVEQTKLIELLVDRGAEVLDVLVTAELHLDYSGGFDAMHGLKDVLKFMGLKEQENSFEERISRGEFSVFYGQVLEEVEKMRETTFYCKVSFYQFLLKSWQRNLSYIDDASVAKDNEGVVDGMTARFPLYYEILRRHVDAASERNELREKAGMAVTVICPRLRAVDLVVKAVLSSLSNKEIAVLADAVCERNNKWVLTN